MNTLPQRFMERVDALIDANLSNEDFCIENLYKELLLSYSHLHRKIKQKTGVSPSGYIRTKRLKKACVLLKNTNLNIGEIAFQTGFNTPTYFSKCFSEHYGYPPTKFRRAFAELSKLKIAS